jgi:peptide/nickel transport system substrate-binding protein
MRSKTILFFAIALILTFSLIFSACSSGTTSTSTSKTTLATTSATAAATATTTTTKASTTAPSTSTAPTAATTTAATLTPQKGGVLTIINNSPPTTWGYPTKAGAGFASIFAAMPAIEGFMDADQNGNLKGKLASSWDIAADKSSITFKLRQGVKFHDGTPFNAQAAKWNLDLFLTRGTGSPAEWKSVEIVDDYTIRVTLKSFRNTQLSNFTYGMISPTAVQKNGEDWAGINPVGTGPFKFQKFVPNTSLEYVRFDDYWGDKSLVDGIKYIYIVDATTASMAYKSGDSLVWEQSDPKTAQQLIKSGNYAGLTRLGPNMYLVPDSANPDSPWSKLDVRQAMEYAIDKQAIVDTFGFGFWYPVYQPNVPSQFGYVPDLAQRKYDQAKAKQLLAKAGYPNGFSTKIITSSSLEKDTLVAVQDYLSAVGITTTIEVQSGAKWADTRISGWNNGLFFVTHGATDYNYCAFLERYFTPTSGYAAKSMAYPPGWVDMITGMMLESDQAKMAALAKQAVKIEVDNAMEIPLWQEAAVYVTTKAVHDMGIGTHGDGFSWNTNKVWISK